MRFSFIVTAWNIESYIGACLASLAPCLRPGDQLIVVDDGSSDRSCEEIDTALTAFAGRGVELCPIYLGANTQGGVGIPANVGLAEATGEAVFFVDGDDWVEPEGFLAARRQFEARPQDILIASYRVYHEENRQFSPPPDAPLWSRARAAKDPEARRHLALQMVGVPWRKIYRRALLADRGLRFPEGAFFYEDNPFHWQVCLSAADIGFCDQVLCSHRIGRAGQTMAATGAELAVFFDHYERILRQLPEPRYRPDALRWLLENMAWHMPRLSPGAHWPYAIRAEETLSRIPEADWQAMRQDEVALRAWGPARALARGDLAGVITLWQQDRLMQRLSDLEQSGAQQEARLDRLSHLAEAEQALREFRALQALHAP